MIYAEEKLVKNDIVIFKNIGGDIEVEVKLRDETVWLTQMQIALLFEKERSVITKHINNIIKEKELDMSVCAKFAHTGSDNKVYQTQYYNLDMIISVGYRVNSKRGIEFRKWASKVLKEYLVKGYSINQKQIFERELQELQQIVGLLSNALINQKLVNKDGGKVLELIKNYTETWNILIKYDEGRLHLPQKTINEIPISYEEAREAIKVFKYDLFAKGWASELFGREKAHELKGIIGNIYQTFNGRELYASLEEKAVNLIYFIIKDHPFSDGNKRIACLLFLLLLRKNMHLPLNIPSPEGLTALAILIAESNPDQKALIIKLVTNLVIKMKND